MEISIATQDMAKIINLLIKKETGMLVSTTIRNGGDGFLGIAFNVNKHENKEDLISQHILLKSWYLRSEDAIAEMIGRSIGAKITKDNIGFRLNDDGDGDLVFLV